MSIGVIFKALSGFYYVSDGSKTIACRGKGKLRYDKTSPVVGDIVEYSEEGTIVKILQRKNFFIRPSVANIDLMVFVASEAKPVTDPFLIDRVDVIAKNSNCDFLLVINKTDVESNNELFEIYRNVGIKVIKTSASTGEGIEELFDQLKGKKSAFTGNSGVGKSSILNMLLPGANIETNEISEKLGRGKHTTRHIEFYQLDESTFVADTPGFASFDIEMVDEIKPDELQYDFIDFLPYLGQCRFADCRHIYEPNCSVINNVCKSRHDSYVKLYDIVSNHKPWD